MVASDSNKSSVKFWGKHFRVYSDSHFKMCISNGGDNLKCGETGNKILLVKTIPYLFVFGKECIHQNIKKLELTNEEKEAAQMSVYNYVHGTLKNEVLYMY